MDHETATEEVDGDEIETEEVDDDEIEGDICRICRGPGDSDHPLQYPCACNGSIKFVHEDCLFQWLRHSNNLHCEVCEHPFSVSRVYADNAPKRLPFHEFAAAIAMRTCRHLHFFMRLSFLLSVWFLAIPFLTYWIWRLAFVRSFGEAQSLFLSHISTRVILTDCLLGFLLSASINFIFKGPNLLTEFLGHWREGVPFDEVVEMLGQVYHLVVNSFIVLANNLKFLGVVIFVPFTLGWVVMYHVPWIFAAARGHAVTAPMHLTDTGLSLENITLKTALTSVSNLTNEGQEKGLLGQLVEMMIVNGSELNGVNNISSFAADLLKGSAVTTLTVGYIFIVFLVFLYFGITALIRYAKGRFYGISSIVEVAPSLIRQFLAAMRHLMTMIKVLLNLVFTLGIFPLMCGWSLDVCTIQMFGKTMSQRVQFLSISPLASSLVHWVVGIMYMLHVFIFCESLREILRPGVLYFLDDSEDEDDPFQYLIDDPVQKVAREFLVGIAESVSWMFVQVFLPVKLAIRMAPSLFPLDISVSDPFTEIPVAVLLFQICVSFMIEHFRLWTTIKPLLRCWFTSVGWVLDLTDFLLRRAEDDFGLENGNVEPGRQNRALVLQVGGPDRAMAALPAADDPKRRLLRAGKVKTGDEYEDDEEQSNFDRCNFVLRIIQLFNSALIVVQVSLGRALFSAIPLLPITHGIKCNDLYTFVIGTCAFWSTISGGSYMIEYVKSRRISVLFNQIWKWFGIVFKSSMLLAIWVFIIPVLIGLLFELLVIVPMRVPVDESPVFLLYQDWALGLIFLKIWIKLVMLDIMLPLVDDGWRARFERVREDGFSRLQGLWVLREIVFPIVMKLLTALCVPYVLAKGMFPMLGYPLVVNSAVYRFAWIGCLSVSLFCFCAKRCHVRFRKLHKAIRDERYLIGLKLHNFGSDVQI